MNITVYVKREDLDTMINFYVRTNNNEQFRKKDIPDIEIHEESPATGHYVELHLHYDIYQGMKYALSQTRDHDKIGNNEMLQVFAMLKKAENLSMQDEVVYSALTEMKGDPTLEQSSAMSIALKEWDIE